MNKRETQKRIFKAHNIEREILDNENFIDGIPNENFGDKSKEANQKRKMSNQNFEKLRQNRQKSTPKTAIFQNGPLKTLAKVKIALEIHGEAWELVQLLKKGKIIMRKRQAFYMATHSRSERLFLRWLSAEDGYEVF